MLLLGICFLVLWLPGKSHQGKKSPRQNKRKTNFKLSVSDFLMTVAWDIIIQVNFWVKPD